MKTYVNPLCLPDMPVMKVRDKGKILEDSLALGRMITAGLPATHERFKPVFGGIIPYMGENDTRGTADPAGFYYKGEWYIYSSEGALWHSKDFVNWDFTDNEYCVHMAPGVTTRTEKDGKDRFYIGGNRTDLFVAEDPKGPFKSLGVLSWNGKPVVPENNDVSFFTDDDGEMYMYWGMGPGIWGARMNRDNPVEMATEPKQIIAFNPENEYERMGQHNQNWENGFPEGSWMVKVKGTYYLIWATVGTQYDTYCMCAYKSSEGPLTGFVPQKRPVALNEKNRLVRGGGHGSVVKGPGETVWCFYTVNIGLESDMERRIACDPVAMDENGDLYVPDFCEEPQFVPGVLEDPAAGNRTGEVNLTARQSYAASSFTSGHPPIYAIDENLMTSWEPASDDEEPSLIVSLQGNYYVSSSRVIFKEMGMDYENGKTKSIFRYRIETMDRNENEWKLFIDRTASDEDYIMDYRRAEKPVYCQFVKLTITGWNKEITPAVVDFTVFGQSAGNPNRKEDPESV